MKKAAMDYKNLDKKNAYLRQIKRRAWHRKMATLASCLIMIIICTHIFKATKVSQTNIVSDLNIPSDKSVLSDYDNVVKLEPARLPPMPPKPKHTWEEIKVEKGDTFVDILESYKISKREIHRLLQNSQAKKALTSLIPGQVLKFSYNDEHELQELNYQINATRSVSFTRKDKQFEVKTEQKDLHSRFVRASGHIEQSLYEAGKKSHIPDKVTMQLAQIFAWQIDFAKDMRPGDSFVVLYEETYVDDKHPHAGNIVAAQFTNRKNTFKAIRFKTNDGFTRYYTPEGESLQKAFIRTPVNYKRISSKFDPKRKHPILNITRPHWGVDLAAPPGTPVKASGDAKVIFAGKKGGYGNLVKLSHGQNITTWYAHLKKVAKGIKSGERVKKGQIIGYVGSTGLASGPHLHYEYRINNMPQNPMTVKLPRGNKIPKTELAQFDSEMKQLIAQLEIDQATQLAENQTQTTQG